MILEPVMLAVTEDALVELAITYARHQTLLNHRMAYQPQHGYRGMSTAAAAAADRAACWQRLVSITEIHAENLLRHLDGGTQEKPPSQWAHIKEGLKKRHLIDVDLLGEADQLEACFLVRNAIAHGLGRFTNNQLQPKKDGKRKDLLRPLRSISLHLRDGAVVITPAARTRCRDTCRTFVAALDHQRPQRTGTTPLTDAACGSAK